MNSVGGEGKRGDRGWLGSRSVSTPPSDEQREVWVAGISSGAWSRRRVSGEHRAFGGRQDLLCLVQRLYSILRAAGIP